MNISQTNQFLRDNGWTCRLTNELPDGVRWNHPSSTSDWSTEGAMWLQKSWSPKAEPKPLPCPFCGSEPTFYPNVCEPESSCYRYSSDKVGCSNQECGAFVKGSIKLPAITRWNTRHTPEADATPKVDEQLEDIVHSLKNIATDPLNNLNVCSDVRDIVFAKAILHLLKR